MNLNILVLDPGSSSLKFGLYSSPANGPDRSHGPYPDPTRLASGAVERLGSAETRLKLTVNGGDTQSSSIEAASITECMEIVLQKLQSVDPRDSTSLSGVGCRVVHGGDRFVAPTRVTNGVIQGVRDLEPLAPLHNPVAADLLEACLHHLPDVPVFAVFDTTFHQTMPDVARTYALPFELCEQHGLKRFGFHGIAHQYVSTRLSELTGMSGSESRFITCHLGNGASICAVKNGKSIDTSMGMTPLEGLVMGTRSGDVDPGLLLYLLQTVGMSAEDLDDMLNLKSGLMGVSGLSADLRDLEPAADNARAELSMALFAYRASKTIGAYAVALEGLDALAFSGGIGEHSAAMRNRICKRLGVLGLCLDDRANLAAGADQPSRISPEGCRVHVWVIPADEDLQIAREVMGVLHPQ